jgi:hypothetical protein
MAPLTTGFKSCEPLPTSRAQTERSQGRGQRGLDVDNSGPTFVEDLKEQLGLKLEPQKGPGEVVIVDHVEKPSENWGVGYSVAWRPLSGLKPRGDQSNKEQKISSFSRTVASSGLGVSIDHENLLEVSQGNYFHRADGPPTDSVASSLVQVGDSQVAAG